MWTQKFIKLKDNLGITEYEGFSGTISKIADYKIIETWTIIPNMLRYLKKLRFYYFDNFFLYLLPSVHYFEK